MYVVQDNDVSIYTYMYVVQDNDVSIYTYMYVVQESNGGSINNIKSIGPESKLLHL
jgi:hypothetical protein